MKENDIFAQMETKTETKDETEIILVSAGNFQEYILDNIKNLIDFNNHKITVLTEEKFFPRFEEILKIFPKLSLIDVKTLDDLSFDKNSKLDRAFRGGFWHLCSLRLFYVYSYMNKYNLQNCVHIENDVTLYADVSTIKFNRNKLCGVLSAPGYIIPAVIYIPKPSMFKVVLDNYDFKKNDMENLARFDETIIERLPIYTKLNTTPVTTMITKNFSKYNIIFDGSAMGQYLGGVDPSNISGDTRGFVNEICKIQYNKNKFKWILNGNVYIPNIQINDVWYPIFNLHIHCKRLNRFMGRNPLETKLITLDDKVKALEIKESKDSSSDRKVDALEVKESEESNVLTDNAKS